MENGWSRAGRLWTLLEWSFIGTGLIFTLIWVSVTGLRNYITSPSASRKRLKHKRVLVIRRFMLKIKITNGHSALGKALAHKLRTDHECNVISLCPRGATSDDIFCDLTINLGLRTQLQELWEQVNGIDFVVNCEAQGQSTGAAVQDVGRTVERIGSNIQRMINLLIHLVPKMIERGSGVFLIVREDCHPPERSEDSGCCEYDELLGQLLSASPTRSSIGLIKLYCPSGLHQSVEMEDTVDRIVGVLESGKMSGIVDLSTKNELWAAVLRKASLGVWPLVRGEKDANTLSANSVQIK